MISYNQEETNTIEIDGKTIYCFSNDTNIDKSTIKSFGDEWKKFSEFSIKEITSIGDEYFDLVDDNILNRESVILDMGCGTGRWSKYLSPRVNFIEAIDPSESILQASHLLAENNNVRITKAYSDNIPFADKSFDFVFSLGVLHHIPETKKALKDLVKKVKPNGHVLLYLYYNLDNRGTLYKIIFTISNPIRYLVAKLPRMAKYIICDVSAISIYYPIIFIARLFKQIFPNSNFYKKIPLSYYVGKSFNVVRNDVLDRFGTPLEQRFSKQEIESMMKESGLIDIRFSENPPFWHAIGKRIEDDSLSTIRHKGRILILANHRMNRSPGQRFRFEQYTEFLEKNGFSWELSYLISEKDDKHFYSKGNWFKKLKILIKCFNKRLKDIKRAKDFDSVFIYREAFFTGTTYFEKKLSKLPVKVIFDFDDSIWLPSISPGNKKVEWLKNYGKTQKIIELSDLVFTGNKYLADYAKNYNKNVEIIPTTIDTSYHLNKELQKKDDRICIGWTGTSTTIQHFELIIPVLKKIKEKYKEKVYFKLIGENKYYNKDLNLIGVVWNYNSEIEDLSEIDIGIMPLPDDEWSKGKCGFKGLQYMSLKIPTIMSPVGVNRQIINNGVNGFLAKNNEEWIEKISLLVESEELRNKLGNEGRKTVESKYSVNAIKEVYISHFDQLIN